MPKSTPVSMLDQIKTADVSNSVLKAQGSRLGDDVNFNAKDVGRYVSYGSATYGKLGYDPTKDMNAVYNANTTGSQDIGRAFTGMWKLAGVGFKDTFAFGAAASNNAHKDFEDVMNRYSSTRGGAAGFISNTMLSSGYTVGIMGAIALEETLLALGTVATGGLGAPAAVVEGGAALARAGKLIDKVGDSINVFKKLSKIPNARTLNWLGKQGNSVTKGLLPAGETMDFLRNYDKLSDLNNFGKTLTGAGAIARDARKIYMTTSESKLEANMAKDEVRTQLLEEWNKKNTGVISETELAKIDKTANDVFGDVYNQNIGLIYVTNAITFDAMFKSMRHTNKMFKMADGLKMSTKKASGKIAVDAVEETAGNILKRKASELTVGKAVKWTATSSMEGVQEVGQDAISEASKGYNLGEHNGKYQGSYYDHLGKALKNINPETFFSGMLMGTFASPVGHAIKAFNHMTRGGGHRMFTDSEAYYSEKQSRQEQLRQDAKILTEFFNQSNTFLDEQGRPQAAISGLQEKMLEAAEKGDRKFFEDNRSEVFRLGMHTMFKNGMEAELLDHLQDMQGYSAEELNQAMDRTDITEDNKAEHINKITSYAERIKAFKAKYDEIQDTEINPINLKAAAQMHKADSPEYKALQYSYHAHEQRKKELLFSSEKINEYAGRMKKLESDITSEKGLTQSDLHILMSPTAVQNEIQRLSVEVKNNAEYGTPNPVAIAKLEALQKYESALQKYESIDNPEASDEVQAELRDAFDMYMNGVLDRKASIPNSIENGNKFDLLWDYMNIGDERKALQDHVNTMMDPTSAGKQITRWADTFKKMDENKEQMIFDSLNAFEERKQADKIMEDLLKANAIFNLNEIDDLIKRGIMPDKFYDVKTHEELTGDRLKEVYAIVASRYKRLTGKKIIASDTAYAGRVRSESDKRTSAGLVRDFAAGKYDTSIKASTLINRLLKSPHLTQTERQILQELMGYASNIDSIKLTRDGDTMISFDEEGSIIIDVRFAGSDYNGSTVPFEYIAVSALLQSHLSKTLSPDLKKQVESVMELARESFKERNPKAGNAEMEALGFFNNPSHFLAESLSNAWLQEHLSSIEDPISDQDDTLWDNFENVVAEGLGETFEGSVLRRAIKLAQLAVSDKVIESVVEEPAIEAQEKLEEETVTKADIISKINKVEAELNSKTADLGRTNALKYKTKRKLSAEILILRDKLNTLQAELKSFKDVDSGLDQPVINVAEGTPSETIDDQTSAGVKIINGKNSFDNLPEDLKKDLARQYVKDRMVTDPIFRKALSDALALKIGNSRTLTDAQAGLGFDETLEALSDDECLNSLDESDFKIIENRMKTSAKYIGILGAYNLKTTAAESNPQATVVAETEEDDTEDAGDDDSAPRLFVLEELKDFIPADLWYELTDDQLLYFLDKLNKDDFSISEVKDAVTLVQKSKKRKASKKKKKALAPVQEQEGVDYAGKYWPNVNQLNGGKAVDNRSKNKVLYRFPVKNVPYMKEFFKKELYSLTPEEFNNLLVEYVINSKRVEKSIKQNGLSFLKIDDPKQQGQAINNYIKSLEQSKDFSTGIAAAINTYLKSINSPFVLKQVSGKGSPYRAVPVKAVIAKVKVADTKAKTLADFFSDLSRVSQSDADFYRIYDWLKSNRIHPDALENKKDRTRKKRLTSKNSKYVSADGIADAIFSDVPERLDDNREPVIDLVISMLKDYDSTKEMQLELEDRMENYLKTEEGYYPSEDELDDDPELQDLKTTLFEFQGSDTYLILTGAYHYDPALLSASDRMLFDQLYGSSHIFSSQALTKEQEAGRMAKEIYEKLDPLKPKSYQVLNSLMSKLTNRNISLQELLVIGKTFDLTPGMNPKQTALFWEQMDASFEFSSFYGMTILRDGDPYGVLSTDPETLLISVRNLKTGDLSKITRKDFILSTSKILEVGDSYTVAKFDVTANTETTDPITISYKNIFDTFTDSMKQYDDVSDIILTERIVEQLSKCK